MAKLGWANRPCPLPFPFARLSPLLCLGGGLNYYSPSCGGQGEANPRKRAPRNKIEASNLFGGEENPTKSDRVTYPPRPTGSSGQRPRTAKNESINRSRQSGFFRLACILLPTVPSRRYLFCFRICLCLYELLEQHVSNSLMIQSLKTRYVKIVTRFAA